MTDETRTPEPAAEDGTPQSRPPTVDELQQQLQEERQSNAALRRRLEQITELVIAKLEASRKHWWERRRALHELGEELVEILKLAPPATPEHPTSLLHRTQSVLTAPAARAWKRWKRKQTRKKPPDNPPESPPP